MTDLSARRADFPLLAQPSNGHRLVFLDSAASAQKPSVVIDAMDEFLRTRYANVHRGAYRLSLAATEAYEHARHRVAQFIGSGSPRQVAFTRGRPRLSTRWRSDGGYDAFPRAAGSW